MGNLLVSRLLIPIVALLCLILFVLRPGGVEGPSPPAVNQTGSGFDHGLWSEILSEIRKSDGTIDFAAVRTAKPKLDRYLGTLRAASPLSSPHRFRERSSRLAYYLNAYNATLVNLIAQHCPVLSIGDIYWADGLFWRVSVRIGEASVTLTDLETNRIEPLVTNDPRIRFAMYRGSVSSPMLQEKAFEGKTMDDQLGRIVQFATKDKRFVDIGEKTVALNPLFFWNRLEFGDFQTWLHRYGVEVGDRPHFVKAPYDDTVSEWNQSCSGYKR